MQVNKTILVTFFLSALFLFVACADKEYPDYDSGRGEKRPTDNNDNQRTNDWIHKEMTLKYYWNYTIPKSTTLNFNNKPEDFFASLLFVKEDRFSYLTQGGVPYYPSNLRSESNAGMQLDLGFEYRTIYFSNGEHIYYVAYTKKGTDAEKKLKRGYTITAVDGQRITADNYHSLLHTGKSQYKLTVRGSQEPIVVKTVSGYNENPVYYNTILELNDKRKVGYLVYNFFENGKDRYSMQYALDLNNVLQGFEQARINELVLDLRYNPGGLVESGTYLASAIVPNRTTDMKYTTREYSKEFDAVLKKQLSAKDYDEQVNNYFRDYIVYNSNHYPIPRLNMKRIYVLTTQNTASASEQIINGLRGHGVDVQIIGQVTTGKNMESFEIVGNGNARDRWILHPLTSKSFNTLGQSDYWKGFEPTIGSGRDKVTDDYQEFHSENGITALHELGDRREPLFATALNHMQGGQQRMTRSSSVPRMEEERGIVIGSSIDRKGTAMIINNIDLEIK